MSGYGYEPGRISTYGHAPTMAPAQTQSPVAPVPAYSSAVKPPAAQMSRLSLAALNLAGAALLVAVLALVFAFRGGAGFGGPGSSEGLSGPLTGQLDAVPAHALTGGTLQGAVSKVVLENGGSVTQLTCPATPAVAQGVVTVCHATIDGDPWAVVVLFEDTDGSFTLDLI